MCKTVCMVVNGASKRWYLPMQWFISVYARGFAMSCDEFKIADLIKLLIENDIQ